LAPRTRAYHEIWLTDGSMADARRVDEQPSDPDAEAEPLYGRTYLPRKFKTAVGLPDDNCVDMYANDLALMAICEGEQVIGYNVLVGGSFGVVPSAKKTFPALAKRMAFVEPHQVLPVAEAVVKVQRDFGNREDRKQARMKYLIARWGLERFKAKVEEYFGGALSGPHPQDVRRVDDHLGWHPQGDGRWFYGINVENGRILDTAELRCKSALREICDIYRPNVRLTPQQSLLLCNIREDQRQGIEQILGRAGVKGVAGISLVRRWSMACPALPTCGLAVSESERVLPGIIDQIEVELARLGLSAEAFAIRMTGCPNGCARPYNADIGLVGKTADKYTIYLGGRILGDRLNFIYQDLVPTDRIATTLVPVFTCFKSERQEGEGFGDFCDRLGPEKLAALVESKTSTKG
jgi:sulfite reductase (ferredoxin)